jgi:hypothetical protein
VSVPKGKEPQVADNLKDEIETKVDDIADIIKKQHAEIETAGQQRHNWKAKLNKFMKHRLVIRPQATWPWYGAANLGLPLQDSLIRQMKPEEINCSYNVSPICELEVSNDRPDLFDVAERATWSFDWLCKERMDLFTPLNCIFDSKYQNGWGIAKVIYTKKYEAVKEVIDVDELQIKIEKQLKDPSYADVLTNPARVNDLSAVIESQYDLDREDEEDNKKLIDIIARLYKGDKIIKFMNQQLIYDAPEVIYIDPFDLIVPADTLGGFDLEKAPWIDHVIWKSPAELLANGLRGKYDLEVVESILKKNGITDADIQKYKYNSNTTKKEETRDFLRNQQEGLLDTGKSNLIKIHEVYMRYDEDGDGIEERHVMNYADCDQTKALRFIHYPYKMRKWPFVLFPFEIRDGRYYSPRGVVEMTDNIAQAINLQHNMKLNRDVISSTPTLIYVPGTVNPLNFKYIPGQPVPVKEKGAAEWMTAPNTSGTFVEEEQNLIGWTDKIAMQNDYQAIAPGRKTAKEIAYAESSRMGVRELDLQLSKMAMRELFERIFSLWIQYGPEEFISYIDNDGKYQILKKTDLMQNYQFTPNGTYGQNMSSTIAKQQKQRNFELLREDPNMFINKKEVYKEFFNSLDPRLSKRIIYSDQEVQKMQQEQQKQQMLMAQMGGKGQDKRGLQQMGGNRMPPGR